MNYGELFEKAWRIIWKHKVLWLFGILAGCASRSGGGSPSAQYNLGSQDFQGPNGLENIFPGLENWFFQLERGFQDGTAWVWVTGLVLAAICIGLILAILSLVLGTFGRTGLVRGAWLADEGAERLTFGQLWNDSKPFFWRVLGLTILLWLVGLIIGIVLILPIIFVAIFTLGCGLICLIPILVILGWLVSVWVELTTVSIVGENLGILDGMRRGWDVIRSNLGPVVVISLIVFIATAILYLLIGLPFLAILVPLAAGFFGQTNISITTGLIAAAVLFLLYLPVAILLGGIIQSYVGTVWTLFFRRVTGRGTAVRTIEPISPAPADVIEPLDVNEPRVG